MRFSTCPAKQFLYLLLTRDIARLSRGAAVGIDAGCGCQRLRRYFRSRVYIPFDRTGYGQDMLVCPIEDYPGPKGDIVVCAQVVTAGNVAPESVMPISQALVGMTAPGGTLLYTMGKPYLNFAAMVEQLLRRAFDRVRVVHYGRWAKDRSIPVSFALALLMHLIPPPARHGKDVFPMRRPQAVSYPAYKRHPGEGRNPERMCHMGSPIMKYFEYAHLPPHLQIISASVWALASQIENTLPDGPEKSAGLRKLLEAKDCFVRAALPGDTVKEELKPFDKEGNQAR